MRWSELNRNDYLVILKQEPGIETVEDIQEKWWCKNGVLEFWSDDLIFDNKEVLVLDSFKKKAAYLYATLYEDTMLTEIIKSIYPNVKKIKFPPRRRAEGINFKAWQKYYGFSIEEFLTQKKYVIIIDSHRAIFNLIDLDLFNWDAFEACSLTVDWREVECE